MKTKLVALAAVAIIACLATASCTKDSSYYMQQRMEWVDLDLPSGLLWAASNVGATAPEGHGDYFAWGETEIKSSYYWRTYKYSNSGGDLSKYCSRSLYGQFHFTDTLTILEPGDDAAVEHIGRGARTPKKEEWKELLDNTNVTWTTENGVNGLLFSATNGNSLFLPAAGLCHGETFDNEGIEGNYWSSSLETSYPDAAWGLTFDSERQDINSTRRYKGLPVRAVKDAR